MSYSVVREETVSNLQPRVKLIRAFYARWSRIYGKRTVENEMWRTALLHYLWRVNTLKHVTNEQAEGERGLRWWCRMSDAQIKALVRAAVSWYIARPLELCVRAA